MDYADLLSDLQADIDDGDLALNASYYITVVIPDISTADSIIVPIIKDSTVVGASVVLGGAISGADAAISFDNSAAASMGTDVTVAFSGSAKGDQFAFTATGNNVITGPDWIEVATDGGSTDAQPVSITLELTSQLNE